MNIRLNAYATSLIIFLSLQVKASLEKGKGQPNFIVVSKLQLICKLYLIPIATGIFLKP